ncbi:MAG: glycosyltransferase [Planctomycetes bacterium]|nr:glycosyltransferase [Planctomycetota bacterium]
MQCRHLGRVVASSELQDGTPFEIRDCGHFQRHCTISDIGLKNHDQSPFLTCAGCPAFSRLPGAALIDRLTTAIASAENGESALTADHLAVEGMSSPKVRHLLCNLQAENYLEVGSWRGSTLVAAAGTATRLTAIDNFSQFDDGTVEASLRANVDRFAPGRVNVITESLFTVDSLRLPTDVDVCFYDGDHDAEKTRQAIIRLFPCLAMESILLVDDTNFPGVVEATRSALAECGADIVFQQILPANGNGDIAQWWNGLWVGVIVKPSGSMVAGICRTYDLPRRLPLLNEAVEAFLRQTWPHKQLVIVNDTPGMTVEFDHPQVKVLNLPTHCETLSAKLDAGIEASDGEVICTWDDDDLHLPGSMTMGISRLGDSEYFNPGAWWVLTGGDLTHETDRMAHQAGFYRRSVWQDVGKHPPMNGPEDVAMRTALVERGQVVFGDGRPQNSQFIYRWNTGADHISGWGDQSKIDAAYERNATMGEPGVYRLQPHWRRDYTSLTRAKLSDQEPSTNNQERPKLTIGMATFRDWPGVWATIQSIRLNHPECLNEIEFVVVDNDPQGDPNGGERSHSAKCKGLCARAGGKYEHFTAVQGTAAAKGRIFDLATAPAVLVLDCHVILPTGSLRRLIDWFAARPDSKDLYQGPCIGDGGYDDVVGTHFAPYWGSLMYGQWAHDAQGLASGEPFEIPMQGCGLFACNKSAWPGFHKLLRGFGPEEFHIHQRIRRNGGKCYCLPWLRWCHRFGNPAGSSPPGLHPTERLRGHLITHLDTGAPALTEIKKHFTVDPHANGKPALTDAEFFETLRQTVREFFPDRADVGFDCPHRGPFLQTVQCEIGCVALRGALPTFACGKHGECAAYEWQQPHKRTMAVCLGCGDCPPN